MKSLLLPFTVSLSLLLSACAVGPSLQERFDARAAADAEVARVLRDSAPVGAELMPWVATQRQRISDERRVAAERFAEQDRQCWKRFAVNACLHTANDERRTALDRLRQEELTLNAMERKRDAETRLDELGTRQQRTN